MGTYFIPHLLPEFKKFLENKDYVGLLDFIKTNKYDVNLVAVDNGRTSIKEAIYLKDQEFLGLLLANNVALTDYEDKEYSYTSYTGADLLFDSIKNDFSSGVTLLLNSGITLEDKRANSDNSLWLDICSDVDILINQRKYIDLFLKNGANIKGLQWNIKNQFLILVEQDFEKAKLLLDQPYLEKNIVLSEYFVRCINYSDITLKIIDLFIENTAIVSEMVSKAFYGIKRVEKLKFLQNRGIDIFVTDQYNNLLVNTLTEEELKELNITKEDFIKHTVSKLECFAVSPLFTVQDHTQPHKVIDWLESNSYIQQCQPFKFSGTYFLLNYLAPTYMRIKDGGEYVTELNVHNLLHSLPQNPLAAMVLEISALEYINHNGYLLIANSVIDVGVWEMFGGFASYDDKKTVLSKNTIEKDFKTLFIHEYIHQAMHIVFEQAEPYAKNDNESKNAYEQTIRLTLGNIYQKWFTKEVDISNFNTTWELGSYVRSEISKDLVSYSNSYLIGYFLL